MELLQSSSTGLPGRFKIYIENKTIIKKVKNNGLGKRLQKQLKEHKEFIKYRDIVENSHENNPLGTHIIKGFEVEENGSYKCEYIEGIRLDKITDSNIDTNIIYYNHS